MPAPRGFVENFVVGIGTFIFIVAILSYFVVVMAFYFVPSDYPLINLLPWLAISLGAFILGAMMGDYRRSRTPVDEEPSQPSATIEMK